MNNPEAETQRLLGRIEAFAKELEAASDLNVSLELNRYLCCDGYLCGCRGETVGGYLAYQLRQALADYRERPICDEIEGDCS